MAFLPLAITALGALKSGSDQANALNSNATVYGYEAKTAAAQGYEAEAQERRNTGQVIGAQVAAAGQSGGGYGGSTGRRIGQSATNAELDALNVRYKSQLQKWSYASQSQNLKDEAGTAMSNSFLKAGGALLKGYSNNYTSTDLS